MRRRIRNTVEFILACIGLGVIWCIPTGVAFAMARGLGALFYRLLRKRRKIAVDNLLQTGVAATPKEAERIAKASFRHFAVLAVESLKIMPKVVPETCDTFFAYEVPQETLDFVRNSPHGALCISAHHGNWELLGRAFSFDKRMTAIARAANNPMVQRLIDRYKKTRNMDILEKESPDRFGILRALKSGSLVAILADQFNWSRTYAIQNDFMGLPTRTITTPARLHLATRCPIFVGTCVRVAPGRFRIIAEAPMTYAAAPGESKDDLVRRITDDINRCLERFIRLYPEQYLWAHRRWRPL
ncbi:MAG: hypothetical protein FWF84_04275 [Kiritimatiellaeota bacterium]|nr:hypothetical protein [Kiritimatiellota bacterium]